MSTLGTIGPAEIRRRPAGLRREEVAMLANLSVTYYTFLEQGRPVRPSAQVLDALAAALRLSAAERRYLYVLAYGPGDAGGSAQGAPGASGAPSGSAPPELLDPAVADLVQRLEPFPTLVKGRRWDVLAANPAACELSAARYPDDPDIAALIAELQRDSEQVRDWLGPVEYSHAVLQVADQPDQTLVTYALVTGS
jgi:transcriptional regulator with XRE-family HTH domain